MNAEILSVGTELLLGGTVNTDARDISLALAELGVNVYWHTVVGDNPARLTECLYRARNRADLIITTGGLGPTCDDLTKQTLARAFDRKLYLNEDALADIREYFAERGRSFTDNNLQQAYLPEGSIMLPNDCGTAPGCIIEDGPVRVVMLPGPPRECVTMLRNYVMPYLQKLSGAVIRSHMIRFFGIGESAMETRLRSFMDGANPTVAPYSREGECWVRVTAKGANEQECEALMEPVIEDICDKMGDLVYGIDCASLEERVLQLLQEKNTSLAVAESCTGGLLAQRITDIPGASAHFLGGVVTYTEDAKVRLLDMDEDLIAENGVVSMPVAAKMAKRVRKALGTDCAIQLNLTLNGSTGVLNVTVLDKVDDGLNAHRGIGLIRRTLGHHALGAGGTLPRRLAAYRNTIERMARDISVVIGNLDDRGMAPGRRSHLDVEVGHTLDKRNIAVVGVGEELGHASAVFIVNALEHLERVLSVAAHGTQHGRGLNTVHTARVGHGHALDVLDDVARAGNIHMIGLATERLARQCRCIGNGNGLGTAERADKLAVQNIAKRGITKGIGRHRYLLLV